MSKNHEYDYSFPYQPESLENYFKYIYDQENNIKELTFNIYYHNSKFKYWEGWIKILPHCTSEIDNSVEIATNIFKKYKIYKGDSSYSNNYINSFYSKQIIIIYEKDFPSIRLNYFIGVNKDLDINKNFSFVEKTFCYK